MHWRLAPGKVILLNQSNPLYQSLSGRAGYVNFLSTDDCNILRMLDERQDWHNLHRQGWQLKVEKQIWVTRRKHHRAGNVTNCFNSRGCNKKTRWRAPNHFRQHGKSTFIFSVTFDYMPQLYKTETVPMNQRDCSVEPIVQDILVSFQCSKNT